MSGMENPADCASRGLFSSELLNHSLWWDRPQQHQDVWPKQLVLPPNDPSQEGDEVCLHVVLVSHQPVLQLDRFTRLLRVTAWLIRFIHNCSRKNLAQATGPLSVQEIAQAKTYWISISQAAHFANELKSRRWELGLGLLKDVFAWTASRRSWKQFQVVLS